MSRTGVSSSKTKGSSTRIKSSDRHSSLHAHGGKSESSSHSNLHTYSHSQGYNSGHVSGHSLSNSKGTGSSYDRGGGSGSYNSSSRSRNRIHGNDSSNNYYHSSYGHSSSSRSGGSVKNRRFIDPNILAQGMSGRYLGARLSALKYLSSDELEKDLRLMDAYNAACITYAQRYFAFCNQNSNNNSGSHGNVQLKHYKGGEAYSTMMVNSGDPSCSAEQINNGVYSHHPTTTFASNNTTMSSSGTPTGAVKSVGVASTNTNMPTYFAMPIKIDPEEEKRIAILRKKIAASEAKREVLETQYLSLRAHYVHESQATKRARDRLDGEMKMFKELIQKRGDVLALRRVRCAAARDILHCLKYRTIQNEIINADKTRNNTEFGNPVIDSNGANNGMEITSSVDMNSCGNSGKNSSNNDKLPLSKQYQQHKPLKKSSSSESTNLKSFWKKLENEIRQTEKATSLTETPSTLKSSTSVTGENNSSFSNSKQHKNKNSNSNNNSSSSGRNKINYDDDAIMPSPSSSSQKNSHSTSSQNKRTKSPTRGDDNSINAMDSSASSSRKKLKLSKGERDKYSKKGNHQGNSNSNSSSNDYLTTDIVGKENNIDAIPWVSQTMPTTPYGVPLLISYLSLAPDRTMGAGMSILI